MFGVMVKEIGAWVSLYLAGFCLASLLLIALGRYWLLKYHDTRTRDLFSLFSGIGLLTLILTVTPMGDESMVWMPLRWFCFCMLMILEILWITYLLEALVRWTMGLPHWITQKIEGAHPAIPIAHHPYPRHH